LGALGLCGGCTRRVCVCVCVCADATSSTVTLRESSLTPRRYYKPPYAAFCSSAVLDPTVR